MIPTLLPHGATARRLEWRFLPGHVRALVEQRCGAPVVEARSQGGGYAPSFASVLDCADGSRHFVKAASATAQRPFAASHRNEAAVLDAMPADSPAPRLRWSHDDGEWVVLGLEHVEGRAPRRPWEGPDLLRCVAALEEAAGRLTPAPSRARAAPLAEELADAPSYWQRPHVAASTLPHLAERQDQAARLAAGFAEATSGSTLLHADVRDDDLLLADDGRALLGDWAWPAVGAAWVDTVLLLLGPRGDGLDVEAVLASTPLTRGVPPGDVDALLAVLTGFYLHSASMPVPTSSPHVRESQRWRAEVCWDWLCERRGWSG